MKSIHITYHFSLLSHAPSITSIFVLGITTVFPSANLTSKTRTSLSVGIFRKSDGRVLGAQALGQDGPAVDKRISALAVAIQLGATIYDLEEAELCYAPQFGSAKDPVNFAGMVAADILRGDMPSGHWDATAGGFLLDVREAAELAVESVPGAVNIPLGELRARLGELPRDRDIVVVCHHGRRSQYVAMWLEREGFSSARLRWLVDYACRDDYGSTIEHTSACTPCCPGRLLNRGLLTIAATA